MSSESRSDLLALTALVPDAGAEVEIYDQHAALKMVVVDRGDVGRLGSEWDAAGVYLLLDRLDVSGAWGAYVGKAPAGVRARLSQHVRGKDHWYRAILVRRDTTFGFNSAQVGWLEGRLYDLLLASAYANVHNSVRPSDETLAPHDRQPLELAVLPISRVLRLIGHDPATPDEAASTAADRGTKRFFGVTVAALLGAGLLTAGERLVSTNGLWPATATVEADGSITFGGESYSAPSAAATAAKGGTANGWSFWAVETDVGLVSLATLRARLSSGE